MHRPRALDLPCFSHCENCRGPGGTGRPVHVHVLPCPDTYRGENLDGAAAARAAIAAAEAAGGRLAAFFSESILSCGGQVRPSFVRKPPAPTPHRWMPKANACSKG